jgi:glycosyltransferase 2 family protein
LSKPSVERPPPSSLRRWLLLAARIVVSVALLAILFTRMDTDALWSSAKRASAPWLLVALALYFASVLASTWRWRLLLDAQDIRVPRTTLLSSYLVANFFNNFLPSNIGGDVVRISDTAGRARSKTLATTVVLVDRGLGLLGLVLIAALGATVVGRLQGHEPSPIWPSWLWAGFLVAAGAAAPAVIAPAGFGRLLRPLSVLHPTWVGERIEKLTSALARFRDRPGALAACFAGAVLVQAILIAYHLAVVHALHIPVGVWDLAVIVPMSFVVQMVPVSLNGLGVREAAFSFYFTRLGLPIQSGVLVSLGATVLMMIFSLSGAAIYMSRGSRR